MKALPRRYYILGITGMQTDQLTLSGTIVYGDDFEEKDGSVVIEQGKIKEIVDEKIESAVNGIIIPSFVNAHTHIGDSIAKEPDFMPLEELVGPGGYKQTILAETPYEALVASITATIVDMSTSGTQMFADFREGGVLGVQALKEAFNLAEVREQLRVKIFGRPAVGMEELRKTEKAMHDTADFNRLFESVDGIGMSSVSDYPREDLEFLAGVARIRKMMFALHAGERNTKDISGAIELEPDFIVHLIKASTQDFNRMQDKDIGAVVCVRSNLVTGMGLPPLTQMLESGLTVGIGTDNVMLNSPNIFTEMEFISKIFRLDEKEVLKLCTRNSATVLTEEGNIGTIEEGKPANLLVIRTDTPNMSNVMNPLKGVVRRATRNDIAAIVYNGAIKCRFVP